VKMDNATRCEASIAAFFDYLLWIELSAETWKDACGRHQPAGPGRYRSIEPPIWPRIYVTKKSRTVTCHMPVCDLTLSDKGGVYPKERWCETRSRALLLRREGKDLPQTEINWQILAVGGQESTQISGDLYALTILHASVADRMVTTEINAYDQETCRKSETPTKFQRVAEPQTDFREACGVETIDSCMIAGKERTKIGYEN